MKYILMDMEGTTTSLSFIQDVLVPYAKERIEAFVNSQPASEAIAEDLQESIWKVGLRSGELQGHVYPDVLPALENWKASGFLMAVYSSVSIEMQKVLLGHSVSGDLSTYIENHFDTTIGQKSDVRSYHAISSVLRIEPSEMLFLSDNVQELDAAKMAGMQTIQLVRQVDAPFKNHKQVRNFLEIQI